MPLFPEILLYCAAGYGVFGGAMYLGQRRLIYRPDRSVPSRIRAGSEDMREVTLTTEDGLDLRAWYRPPTKAGLPTLLYLHGNGGHIGYRGHKVRPFLDAGYGVLLVSWRGYGGNPGRPSEQGLYRDARAGLALLKQTGVASADIFVYGESIGSGPAVQMAVETPVGGVILEAPFTSIPDIAQQRYWYVPARFLVRDQFDNLAKISTIGAPLLILHGDRDTTVPVRHGRALLAAARPPKRGVFYPNADHDDLYDHSASRVAMEFMSIE